ncbi:magnesium transporter CorA family protein [Candidatus Saccharibacteria bacterium]|jgi:magnesium transporter|nr:magnesium transporter CorA family protein [Candidatus Saccharibacteria bacterium]MBP9131921.1 magnesium transporter CorA family protein [Candidatus Saccharibacteria bacterium]
MIKYLFRGVTSASSKIEQIDNYKKGAWIYVENPSEDEINQLVEKFGVDEGHLDDALDIDEVPRFEVEGKHNYIFTRFVYNNDHLQAETVPMLFIIGADTFITVSAKKLPQLDNFLNSRSDVTTTQRTKLLLQLLTIIVGAYNAQLTSVSRQIKSTRSRLRVEDIRNSDFINFVAIEDQIDDFLSSLAPTNAILRRLLSGRHIKLFEEDEDILEDLLLNSEQSIESSRASIKTIVNIREAYSTIMGNNLNRVIRQLTVLTVLMTVPEIVGSIYGMNVALPFDHHPFAFGIIIIMIVSISVLLLIFFRRQRWF